MTALLALAILVPLALSLVPLASGADRGLLRLLPWAPLPGLLAAILVPLDTPLFLDAVLLGMVLTLDAPGAVFLGAGALAWMAAGFYAQGEFAGRPERRRGFLFFWFLTLAGSLGVFVAGDGISFYMFFAMVSLPAYGFVVHERTPSALAAGRLYIVLAVIGEIAFFLGLAMAGVGAETLAVADLRAGLADGSWRYAATFALLVGFGIKAGLVPLHMWLPRAHPVAPIPASAVLSGVIVKAGIVGLLRFMPPETAVPGVGLGLIAVGFLTSFYGAAAGLRETNPKIILAYSTLSQMGFIAALIGAGLAALPDGAPDGGVVALYAAHHALAKTALFLAVGLFAAGIAGQGGRLARLGWWAAVTMLCLGIAGLPLTGGAVAKFAAKRPLDTGLLEAIAAASAVATALLMLHWLRHLAPKEGVAAKVDGAGVGKVAGFTLAAAAALAVPWGLLPALAGPARAELWAPAALWAGLWPLALSSLAMLLFWGIRVWRRNRPAIRSVR